MNKIQLLGEKFNISEEILSEIFNEHLNFNKLITYPSMLTHPIIDTLIGQHKPNLRIHLYGRPMSGKTSFAISLAVWAVVTRHWKVLWVDAGGHFPDIHIGKQIEPTLYNHIDRTFSIPISELALATKYYDMIIIDDLTSCSPSVKNTYSRLSVQAGLNCCQLVAISQVRRDIYGTKDLIPEQTVTNSDLILNLGRAEQADNISYAYRYHCTVKGYHGRLVTKTCSFIIDHLGLNIARFILTNAIRKNYYQRAGVKIAKNGKIIGSLKEFYTNNRYSYNELNQIWEVINGI